VGQRGESSCGVMEKELVISVNQNMFEGGNPAISGGGGEEKGKICCKGRTFKDKKNGGKSRDVVSFAAYLGKKRKSRCSPSRRGVPARTQGT